MTRISFSSKLILKKITNGAFLLGKHNHEGSVLSNPQKKTPTFTRISYLTISHAEIFQSSTCKEHFLQRNPIIISTKINSYNLLRLEVRISMEEIILKDSHSMCSFFVIFKIFFLSHKKEFQIPRAGIVCCRCLKKHVLIFSTAGSKATIMCA